MNYITRYAVVCMLVSTMAFGMEPGHSLEPKRKKVDRKEPLPNWLEEQLVQAKQSKVLDLEPPLYDVCQKLRFVDQGEALAQRIKTLPLLHAIRLGRLFSVRVAENAIEPVDRAIATLPYLQSLELKVGACFGESDDTRWQSKLSMIRYARALESLRLSYLPASVSRLSQLGCVLAGSQITHLFLNGNDFGKLGKPELDALFGPVAHMRALCSLGLRSSGLNHFDAVRWHILGSVIRRIKSLDLGDNDFGFVPARHFYFELYDMYDELWLSHMGDNAWQALADELVMSEIEELGMAYNSLDKVSDRVWALFVRTLEWMKHLKTIDIRGNNFWRVGLKRHELLAEALMRNRNRPTLIINVSDDPTGFWANLRDRGLLSVQIR